MPRHLPNMTGVMMDDFFRRAEDGQVGVLDAEQLQRIRGQLAAAGRLRGADAAALDLWVVLYDHQLDMPVHRHLAQCDVVTFWTWEARNLERLEENAAAWQALAANSRRVLGCYMWDYGGRQPMPLDLMERQCELGRQWLRQGRIHGLIFLASCICDLELEAVEWTRRWLQAVGDEPLP